MTAFGDAWDSIRKTLPGLAQHQKNLLAGKPMTSFMPYSGAKSDPQYAAIMQYLYGKAGGNRRLVEPFAGALNLGFATGPEQGLFGSDRNPLLMDVVHPTVRDKPWDAQFDPRSVMYQVGDVPKVYAPPSAPDPMEVLTELPEIEQQDIDHARGRGVAYDEKGPSETGEHIYLPLSMYSMRARINAALDKLNAGEIGHNERLTLGQDAVGLAHLINNGIFRWNPEMTRVNPAAGGAIAGRQSMDTYSPLAGRTAEMLHGGDTGQLDEDALRSLKIKHGPYPFGGPSFIPQPFPGGDLKPWNLDAHSDRMGGQWRFKTQPFQEMFDTFDFSTAGDFEAIDAPYGGDEKGQHLWSDADTASVMEHHKETGEMGVPSVQFNAANPRTLAAIESAGLPLSILLSRQNRIGNRGASRARKAESVITQNIPGLNRNWFSQFMQDRLTEPHARELLQGDRSFQQEQAKLPKAERGGASELEERYQPLHEGAGVEDTQSIEEMIGDEGMMRWWVENDPTKLGWYRKLMQERAEAGI